jgi:hypothetical protein
MTDTPASTPVAANDQGNNNETPIALDELAEAVDTFVDDEDFLLADSTELVSALAEGSNTTSSSSNNTAPDSPKSSSKRTAAERSPHPSPSKDLYDEADASRVISSGSTTSASTDASKRMKKKTGEVTEEQALLERLSLITDNFPEPLSDMKKQCLAKLDVSSILFLSEMFPNYMKDTGELSLDVIDQLLGLDGQRQRFAYLMEFQRHLIEKALTPDVDRTAQVNTNTDGLMPDDVDVSSEQTTVSMSPTSELHELDDEMPELEAVPGGGDIDDAFANLAAGLEAGTWVPGTMPVEGTGKKPRQRWDCVEFGQYNTLLFRNAADISIEEVLQRHQYLCSHASNPGQILNGPIQLSNIPWTHNLPCGQQPLLIKAGCTGACGMTMNYGICAGEKCFDMHQFRNRATCPLAKDGPGHGRKCFFWIDELLMWLEINCPSRIPSLAKHWKPQILQSLAWRMWKDDCEENLRAGKDDPITEAQKANRREFAARMQGASTNATARVTAAQTAQPLADIAPMPQPQQTTSWDNRNASVGNSGHAGRSRDEQPPRRPTARAQPNPRGNASGNSQSRPRRPSPPNRQPTMHHYAAADNRRQHHPTVDRNLHPDRDTQRRPRNRRRNRRD